MMPLGIRFTKSQSRGPYLACLDEEGGVRLHFSCGGLRLRAYDGASRSDFS